MNSNQSYQPASQSSGIESQGVLYVVATPIGNLGDISDRMREILAMVSRVAAEDTRRARQLLSHIGVNKPCFSLHEHNERQKLDYIVQQLSEGESIALISDAGTPLISDPGYPLVTELRAKGLKVVPIPGPCALITALSAAGLPSDRFIFEGFLPAKQGARLTYLKNLLKESGTIIFYESSHRIKASLSDMQQVFGSDRHVVIARELTKTFETFLDGELSEVSQILDDDPNQCRGEFVVMLRGAAKANEALSVESQELATKLIEYLPIKQAAKVTAEMFGDKKNQIYQFLLSNQR
ncbi:16S rRNA (cytidine(1402)-2'-O)-methyltransferase [Aliikangiella coralliicola]|uniref:Ribosomal RNA small subunit methyltransferase I n=1 Tax=Aliikangiella coralliicola TaxID=2592383 RepID=A0A545UK38_9GAMM|nr:16S rRNA (cytidine(1402)-2'-O)-methyltransferase [Aliikangiella coralliicola]TQV89819.1 16S rRNA (cytidine(1402)-2'-O)-methyltransferase [Aliikangiella coralliicola]